MSPNSEPANAPNARDDVAAAKQDLLWNMKSTAGSRFNAFERLRARDKRINILNAVARAAVIFLSVVPAAAHTSETVGTIVVLVTVFASIMILVTSLLQFASDDAVNAERMHQCGLEIAALRRRLLHSDIENRQQLHTIAVDYDRVLARYPNHSSADYQRYRDEHPEEFRDRPLRGKGPGGVGADRAQQVLLLVVTVFTAIAAMVAVGLTLWVERAASLARALPH